MPGFEAAKERAIATPWGDPSDRYVVGKLAGKEVAFLARHGRGHRLSPSELNFRANIYGFKSPRRRAASCPLTPSDRQRGAQAARLRHPGSVRRSHARPRLDVLRRRTRCAHRIFSPHLSAALRRLHLRRRRIGCHRHARRNLPLHGRARIFDARRIAALSKLGYGRHRHDQSSGSESSRAKPRFATSPSRWSPIADCWHPDHDAVTVTDIIANLTKNAENAAKVVAAAVRAMPENRECKCGSALAQRLTTRPGIISRR